MKLKSFDELLDSVIEDFVPRAYMRSRYNDAKYWESDDSLEIKRNKLKEDIIRAWIQMALDRV